MRALAGADADPTSVRLPRPRPADPRRHEALFRAPIEWGTPAISLVFDASLLARPLPRSDAPLFGYLARRAEALAAELPAEASFGTRARREIGLRLASGEPTLTAIARSLGVSERTLHRRLAEEGTGFAELLDDARRERAFVLLSDPRASASEVAYLLGYAGPSAFFRAFKRWTGETPRSFRSKR